MEQPSLPEEITEALDEFRLYLSDAIPPLVVAESVELLIESPPDVAARAIGGWAQGQLRSGASIPDLLYHAVTKLHMLGEFKLVDKARLDAYLEGLESRLLDLCPEGELASLAESFRRIGSAEVATSSQVEFLHRQGGAAAGPAATGSAGAAVGPPSPVDARVFSLLLDRLGSIAASPIPQAVPGAPAAPAVPAGPAARAAPIVVDQDTRDEILARLVSLAARRSATSEELEAYFNAFRRAGVDGRAEEIFRAMGRSLPGWVIPAGLSGEGGAPIGSVEAMHRLVTMPPNPSEGIRRFDALLRSALEQFNDGSLGRAVTMFDLAERIISENKIPPAHAEAARRNGHLILDPDRLRAYAEKESDHLGLRRVLSFFPSLSPEGLLDVLKHEEKRDRRRLWLALLEVHGRAARDLALSRLKMASADPETPDWFFLRNLVSLLRQIPRDPEAPVDPEVFVVSSCAPRGSPIGLWKEVISYLGQAGTEGAASALIARARDIEAMLVSEEPLYGREDLLSVLDRCMSALARVGVPPAIRAVVDHGLRKMPAFGDSLARLAVLSSVDLSGEPAHVARILEALRAELPGKILGIQIKRSPAAAEVLIQALSSTRAVAVRDLFEQIQGQFRDHPLGLAASKALAAREAPPPPASPEALSPTLSGDIELFGLPNLLQQLAQTEVTGILSLDDASRGQIGVLLLDKGKLRSCRSGMLRNREAFFQLFERPVAATFFFVSQPADGVAEWPLVDLLPLIFEGARRYDELREASAIVPDGSRLAPTSGSRTTPEGETDVGLVQSVWARIAGGATALECEESSLVDAYRVRRLLAHWVEEGALQARV